jgi:hypothetical protein
MIGAFLCLSGLFFAVVNANHLRSNVVTASKNKINFLSFFTVDHFTLGVQVTDSWNAIAPVPQDVAPFEIRLYNGASMSSPGTSISVTNTNLFPLEEMHTFPYAYNNWATMVSYNLPVGYVISLVQDTMMLGTTFSGVDFQFENQLRWVATIELIGTGKPEAKMLDPGTKTQVNGWCLYKYDVNLGYVEVFTGTAFTGNRAVLFPSRYSFNTLIPFKGNSIYWYIDNKIKSIRWDKLDNPCYFTFYRNYDSSGARFGDVNGKALPSYSSISDLSMYEGVSATLSSMVWAMVAPLSIEANSVAVPGSNIFTSKSLTKTVHATVVPGSTSEVEVSLDQTWTKTSSITKTTSVTNAWSFGVSFTVSMGGGLSGYEASLTVSFEKSSSTTQETTRTQENSEAIQISESHSVSLTEPGNYEVTASIDIMDVDPISLLFTVTKTYDFPVCNGIQVGSLWKRTEVIPLTVSGSFRSDSSLVVKSLTA